MRHSLSSHVERWLGIDPEGKRDTYLQVFESARITSLTYWLELFLSAGIATLGLVLNSPAVVIGAMLVSPLMGPIIAAGLALAAGDLYLGIRSLVTQAASVLGAILISSALVYWLPFHVATTEIAARTHPNLLDLGVAVFSGLAGSIYVARGRAAGGTTALPGVAIAVALMPPLCTMGFGVGTGLDWAIIGGAGLLFLTNLAAIVASAFFVFFLIRMDFPDARLKMEGLLVDRGSRYKFYRMVQRSRFAPAFIHIGKLRWRVLMLAVVLAALYVPLRNGLVQVREETVARTASADAIRLLSRQTAIVSQQVDWAGAGPIQLRLISTEPVSRAKIVEAERVIRQRTRREARISLRQVASQEELSRLQARLTQPAPPPIQDLDTMRAEAVARLRSPLAELWPADLVKLVSYEVGFRSETTLVRIAYEAPEPLSPAMHEILLRSLRGRLGTENLELVLEDVTPPPPVKIARRRAAAK